MEASVGGSPELAVLAQWRDRIRAADASGTALALQGGGTKAFLGEAARGERFDTRAYQGIVAFEPTELVVTVRCGTPLRQLQAELAAARQMLAFEPPAFGDEATIGGVVAAGLSGPRRASAGALRDFVLGACLLDARGQWLRFGGQVMKNVAGYDVSRLLAGSMGVLGLIAEVSLKVLPMPAREMTMQVAMDQTQALQAMNRWAGQPLPISASAWVDGVLHLRLSGALAAVKSAAQRLAGEQGLREVDEVQAQAFWEALREHRLSVLAQAPTLWRLSLPSTAPMLAIEAQPVIEWGGALRWYPTDIETARVRDIAAAVGGSAMRFRTDAPGAGVFHPLSPANARLHARLKREFDPNRIFNPGRLYPDL